MMMVTPTNVLSKPIMSWVDIIWKTKMKSTKHYAQVYYYKYKNKTSQANIFNCILSLTLFASHVTYIKEYAIGLSNFSPSKWMFAKESLTEVNASYWIDVFWRRICSNDAREAWKYVCTKITYILNSEIHWMLYLTWRLCFTICAATYPDIEVPFAQSSFVKFLVSFIWVF